MPKFSDYPDSAVNAAKRAISHKEKNGTQCGTQVGWVRARQIANKQGFDEDMIKRIFSFLSRAKVYDQGKYTDENGGDICGSIMYDAWGGDSMRTWAEGKLNKLEKERKNMQFKKEIEDVLNSIKALFSEEKPMTQSRTLDGSLVEWEGETLSVGAKFYVLTDEGKKPAENGSYELENGDVILVEGSTVKDVFTKMHEEMNEFNPQEFAAIMSRLDAVEAKLAETEQKLADAELKLSEAQVKFSEVKTDDTAEKVLSAIEELRTELSKLPLEQPVRGTQTEIDENGKYAAIFNKLKKDKINK